MPSLFTSRHGNADAPATEATEEASAAGVLAKRAALFRAVATEGPEQFAQVRLAIDSMSEGLIAFDIESRVILCNESYLRIYKLAETDVKPGLPLRDLLALKVNAGTFFGDIDFAVRRITSYIDSGSRHQFNSELVDGRVISIVATPMGGGAWVSTHDDITELWRAEKELSRTKNFLDLVIDHVPATILVKDASTLRYLLINKRAEAYFERPRNEIIGRSADDIFPPDVAAAIATHDQNALSSEDRNAYERRPLHLPEDDIRTVHVEKIVLHSREGSPEYLLSIIEDVTERVRTAKQLTYQAQHDALTGLPNRAAMMQHIDALLARMNKDGQRFTVMLLDLDRFKSVNDSLGHLVGDALLTEVASRLRSALTETEIVARLGGDEFAVIQVANGDQRECALALSNRILDVLADGFRVDGHQIVSGTSIGIAFAPEHGFDVEKLMKAADLALYRAKARGRNQYCIFEPSMEAEAHSLHEMENAMRRALRMEEFELVYQPVYNIASGRPTGAEALIRWRQGDKLVSPADFIPLAEETGLIVPLGDWVLRSACATAMTWPANVKVAVNVSPVQFRHGDIVDTVACALVDSGLEPERLELEITESVLLHDNEHNLATLAALKSLGVSIVLDDFGTGYSSLSYLKMFPFDKIKIDRSFVDDLSNRPDCAAIVCAIVNLARILNMATTAEGVETEDQLTLLRAAGCAFAQGYHLSRPVSADRVRIALDPSVRDIRVA